MATQAPILCRRDRLRRIANWLNLSTPLGLIMAQQGRAKLGPGPACTILAAGYDGWLAPRASAITIGDVILLRISAEQLARRPQLLQHEARHSTQWAICLGVVGFPAAYGLAALWSIIRVGDPARGNPFERLANLADGGYSR